MSTQADDKLYPEDVFSTYLRTGTGADVTTTTGIDMTKGYMLWTKGRSGETDHAIYDSSRGVTKDLVISSTKAETIQSTGLKSVSSTGHTIGSLAKINTSAATYVDYVFRKAPKFFDVVTYTGDGVAGRQIPHSLGCDVGMIVVKGINVVGGWTVWHRSLPFGKWMYLNTNQSEQGPTPSVFGNNSVNIDPTSSVFTVGNTTNVNSVGVTYVAYLYAHDTSADGIIQCGSYTSTSDQDYLETVELGWEPQWIMIKRTDSSAGWIMIDNMRGCVVGGNDELLFPDVNLSSQALQRMEFTATGFTSKNLPGTYIYTVIRRPMKVPTSGTEIFQPVAYTGTNVDNRLVNTGILTDMVMARSRTTTSTGSFYVADRLRGNPSLGTAITNAEITDADSFMTPTVSYGNAFSAMNGFGCGNDLTRQLNSGTNTKIAYALKRAKGFFDVVCNSAPRAFSTYTATHNLGVQPELIIGKTRNTAYDWVGAVNLNGYVANLSLNSSSSLYVDTLSLWDSFVTDTTFESSRIKRRYNGGSSSSTTDNDVWYLFATLAGISKVGSYTGNGTSQTIDCGFKTGARFILIKRTDNTGDWYIWDTARGIVAANDPHLSINTTAAEVTTDDSVDPSSEGFICNQNTATNINVNLAQYIYLSIS
jgi:hypothetical protein